MESTSAKAAASYQVKTHIVQFKYGIKLLELVELKEGDKVLDLGCGSGNLAAAIARKLGSSGKVVGIDPDADRIKIAEGACKDFQNISFHTCKSIDFPYDESAPYDHVITNTVLHWIKSDEKILTFARIFNSLKPGGTFVGNMTMRDPTNIAMLLGLLEKKMGVPLHREHLQIEGPDWLRKRLEEAGFEIVKFGVETYFVNMGSLEDYLEWLSATFYGKFDFREFADPGLNWLKFEDGSLKHDSEVAVFLVKKPLFLSNC